ncbi:MAG: 4Fe-4S dicluster domain-containing protein [Candidatus Ranarchaeia archaeon]
MSEESFMGVPRNQIIWYPTIDLDKCDLCGDDPQCLKFCPHNVYSFSKRDRKLTVSNPTNCVVFCRACSKVCSANALSFPEKKEVLARIKEMRSQIWRQK